MTTRVQAVFPDIRYHLTLAHTWLFAIAVFWMNAGGR
jgi:hypothetical protein